MKRIERTEILVCYDVNTLHEDGKRRLRRVAKICERYGQRGQFSVFECSVSATLLFEMRDKLIDVMDPMEDSLRIYTLHGTRNSFLFSIGRDSWVDFHDPLVI